MKRELVLSGLGIGLRLLSILLLPPVCLAMLVPLVLFGLPVALVGIPFMLPALLTGTLSARSEARRRASYRPLRQGALAFNHKCAYDKRTY